MNFKILEYIVAIAETGSVTKAAERLFISQSGLNQQLIKLEAELGTPLFHRSKKEMRPTHAGRIYIENARRILKMAQNCVSQINDLSENPRGTISFGLPYEHGADLFISIAKAFSHAFPNVAITLTEQNVREMENNVQTDRLDLAFVMVKDKPSSRYFDCVHLCTERLVLGIPRKHPMAQYAAPTGKPLNTMDLKHFKNDPFAFMFSGSTMRSVIDPLFEEAGSVHEYRYHVYHRMPDLCRGTQLQMDRRRCRRRDPGAGPHGISRRAGRCAVSDRIPGKPNPCLRQSWKIRGPECPAG